MREYTLPFGTERKETRVLYIYISLDGILVLLARTGANIIFTKWLGT